MAVHKKTQEGTAVLEREVDELRQPPMYQVLLLNDDFTPMDFVVYVLQHIFRLDHDRAMLIMLEVHTEGRGICGIYTKDIAASKVEQVVNLAREHQHPLACVMEEAP
jgi:ATP-dependent Clp protease adaptor protein ClpS